MKVLGKFKKPLWFEDDSLENVANSKESSHVEPRSFREAFCDPVWQKSMQEEYDSLMGNGTWILLKIPEVARLSRTNGFIGLSRMEV